MTTQSFLQRRVGSGLGWRRVLPPVAALLLSLAAPALAQTNDLPSNLVRATATLSAADEDALKKYVDLSIADLGSDDPVKVKRARTELLKPLTDAEVGAPFRLSYSKVLEPALSPLVKDKRELVAGNSLRIAGEVASTSCAALVLSQLDRAEPSVRFLAVQALARTIEAVGRTTPAIDLESCNRIMSEVGARLEKEKDAWVADIMVRTLAAGVNVSREKFDSLPAKAFSELCKRTGDRTRTLWNGELDDSWADTLVVAGSAVRDRLTTVGTAALRDEARNDALRLAGDMLAYLKQAIDAKSLPAGQADARERPRQIAALAEAIVALAAPEATPKQSMADLIKRADAAGDAGFLDGASLLIGADGALVKKFGLPASRFTKK
ncbi:MAG: hypothetical protein IT434_15815 [Phycisphaerales bacterium]|nr:hypothetical protein [Phycisphaerales bacterium]